MSNICKVLGMVICGLIWTANYARGQPEAVPGKVVDGAKDYIDQEVKRHRWELNINAGNLFKLGRSGTYQYPYLVKLNSKRVRNGWGRAWRVALSPQVGNAKQYPPGDTSLQGSYVINNYDFKPFFVFGHEWQKIHGRTMLLGGIDFAGILSFTKGTAYEAPRSEDGGAPIYGTLVTKFRRNMVWLGPFLGVEIYLNHRISVSVESHMKFGYGEDRVKVWFDQKFISRSILEWNQIEPLPCYLINLSYNL